MVVSYQYDFSAKNLSVISYSKTHDYLHIDEVRNADRKCKAKTNFAAYGQNLGEYAAKPRQRRSVLV